MGGLRSQSQGAPSTDGASDGTSFTDVGRMLEGLSDSVEGGRSFVNSFRETGGGDGEKKKKPVQIRQGGFMGLDLKGPLGIGLLLAGLVAAFFIVRKFAK